MITGIFTNCSRKELSSNLGFEGRMGFTLAVRNGFDEDDGFQNSPLGLESRERDGCSMGSRGKGRRKGKEKEDTRTTESIENVATVPRQRRQKAC